MQEEIENSVNRSIYRLTVSFDEMIRLHDEKVSNAMADFIKNVRKEKIKNLLR